MIFKNISYRTKTFYGVVFKPGDCKEVPGPINDPRMIRVQDMVQKPARMCQTSTRRKDDPQIKKPTESKSTKEDTINGENCDQ